MFCLFTFQVAIKTIKKCKIETEADLIRIRREIQIMSSLRHPYIIHIYEGKQQNNWIMKRLLYIDSWHLFVCFKLLVKHSEFSLSSDYKLYINFYSKYNGTNKYKVKFEDIYWQFF